DQQQAAPRRVPEREREHAAEAIDRALAPLLVRVNDHLGVGVRAESMAGLLQGGSDLREVIDLAVEDHPDGSIFIGERLIAGGQVDDAEASMAQADAASDVKAVRIGPAMRDHPRHRAQALTVERLTAVE